MGANCSTKKLNEKENLPIPIILGNSIDEEVIDDMNCFDWFNIYITDIGKNPSDIIDQSQEWKADVDNNYFVGIDRQVFYIKFNNESFPTSADKVSLIVYQVQPHKLVSDKIYNVCIKKNNNNKWFMLRKEI